MAPNLTLPTSILAFITTVHAAMVVLRIQRSAPGFPWAVLPSVGFTVATWLFPSPVGLAAALGTHLLWFVACEKLMPMPQVATAAAPAARPAAGPASGSRPGATAARPPAAARASAPAAKPAAAAPVRPKDFVAAPVLAVLDETPTIRTYRIARPEGFSFEAGQFLTVRVQVDGKPHVRCYSISSAPETTGYLELSVKRQGLVSGMLHSVVRPGSNLMVKPPAGRFVYPASDDRPIVLVAGGVGITPLVSMLRHAVAADPTRPVTLLYSVRAENEVAFQDELALILRRHKQVRVAMTVSGATRSRWRVGRIDQAMLEEHVPDAMQHSLFMMCGPLDMISGVRHTLEQLGVPPPQIRSEVFQAAAAIGARPSPAEALPALELEPSPESESESESESAAASGTPHLVLVKSNRETDVAPSQTLLEAAECAGAEIPSMCRMGVCGACRTRVVDGDVQCTSDALDDGDREAGYVLPCVSWAKSDCALEA